MYVQNEFVVQTSIQQITVVMLKEFMQINVSEHYDDLINGMINYNL